MKMNATPQAMAAAEGPVADALTIALNHIRTLARLAVIAADDKILSADDRDVLLELIEREIAAAAAGAHVGNTS